MMVTASITLISIIIYYAINNYLHPPRNEVRHVILLLGCANPIIQNQRIQSVIAYINSNSDPVTLYLSGGSNNGNVETEASIMQRKIQDVHPNIDIYTDHTATNTAENFVNFSKWMQESDLKESDKVVITTSDFHKTRAEKLFNGVISEIIPEWNLSVSDCRSCWESEPIHMKNVDADIFNALRIQL